MKFLQGSDLEEIKEVVVMTRLGQMLYDDGLKAGKSEGRIEGRIEGERIGEERLANLLMKLSKQNRQEDSIKALEDLEYRKKLYEEFGV